MLQCHFVIITARSV